MQKKWLWFLVFIIIAAAGAWYFLAAQHAAAPTQAPQARLSADLYPLFSGISWSEPVPQSTTIGTSTASGALITSATSTNTMNPGAIFAPFNDYYDQKLKALGWQVANDLAAGGPMGGVAGYRKGSGIILVSYQILYHDTPANAPSQCPCSVTLSLFSSN